MGVLHTHFTDRTFREQTDSENIRGQRVAISLLGDGYIEAIEDDTIIRIAADQRRAKNGSIAGQVVRAPVLETRGKTAVGRLGWKSQHESVVSSVADALRTELGVGNFLYPLTAKGFASNDLEQSRSLINDLALFIRKTEYPQRDKALAESNPAQVGSRIFSRLGCSFCHVDTFVTAPAGTKLHDGSYTVPKWLGKKTIHPFSDFLLHDVGTGDGIVQSALPQYADQSTANKFRTAPLWGVRFRTWMMHDGKAVTFHQAIMRHEGEAAGVIDNYQRLTPQERHHLWEFLDSL